MSQHVTEVVDAFVHDLLGPAEAGAVREHCITCSPCHRALAAARARLAAMQSLPPTEPPAELEEKTMARVDAAGARRRTIRRRFTYASAAALLVAAIALGSAHAYYANLTPTNYDVVVLGQRQFLAGTSASLRVRVLDRAHKKPVANASVSVALLGPDGRRETLASFTTDESGGGGPRFDVPDWADGKYELEVIAKPGGFRESVTRPVVLRRSWKLMLSSDKPVYKPGQTVQMRAMTLRRPDLRPVGEQPATFTLTDPRGNVLFQETKATSPYGITSASCELASELDEGSYVVACVVGEGTQQAKSQMAVDVRRYVLPKFTVDVKPDRDYYAPGETAKVTVSAEYVFGKPVTKAAVELRLLKAGGLVETLKGETDDKGKIELKFALPPAKAESEDEGLAFVATVTDGANQKQERAAGRLLTTKPVRVTVIPESGALVRGVPNVVYMLATRADGSPVPGAKVAVSGSATATTTTDERGAASFTVTPGADTVTWTIRVVTKDGELLARRYDRLRCGRREGDFLIRTDRAAYQGGQTVTLTAFGAGEEPVYVDFMKHGLTMASHTIGMAEGKGEVEIDLPADVFGTLEMVAYRFGDEGLAARKRRVLYVSPPDSLKITAKLDKDEYRPGKAANLRLSLTDKAGKRVPGAISLAAVDEAVFAVLAQKPGSEQAFYTIEDELLKPVYATQPWSPGEGSTPGRDQALFAATSRSLNDGVIEKDSLHSLAARSFPARAEATEEVRERRLGQVGMGWIAIGLTGLALGYASMWMFLTPGQMWNLHVFGALAVMGGCVCWIASGEKVSNTFSYVGTNTGKVVVSDDSRSMSRRDGSPTVLRRRLSNLDMDGDVTLNYNDDRIEGVSAARRFAADDEFDPFSGGRDWAISRDPVTGLPVNPLDEEPLVMSRLKSGRGEDESGRPAPRVRRAFPETLLWRPNLITDDHGDLSVPIPLADSITRWRLAASAVSADGRLGATQLPMKVFQPFFVEFNLPVFLTRGDEVGVPVVVYNYLDKPQSVKLSLAAGEWFTLDGAADRTLDLGPGEVRSVRYTVKVHKVGTHKLRVTALAGDMDDAIEREIEVVPDGKKVEVAHNGALDVPATHILNVPNDAVEGSVKAFVKLYPSGFSQLVEGADGIFRMPSGCFEQTSSTTYPNVLALQYLRTTKQRMPEAEAKARKFIHLGYQRLTTFEVQGGGFSLYGQAPASRTLSAYGLREFVAMAKVHPVDAKLIERTRSWLMSQRKADGTWLADHGARGDKSDTLLTTAYIAAAVYDSEKARSDSATTLDYLLTHDPRQIKSAYALALVCNALLAIDPEGKDAAEYLDELVRRVKAEGKHAWWPTDERTLFYGGGESATIEATALATLALKRSRREYGTIVKALAWLVSKKDAYGTWHSTQATVLALESLVAGTGRGAEKGERRVIVKVGDKSQQVVIPASQSEVVKFLDVTEWLKPGDNAVSLVEETKTAANYQVSFRYHVAQKAKDERAPFGIEVVYDKDDVKVGGTVKVTATASAKEGVSPMVMLELPVPPGFDADGASFARYQKKGTIAKYETQPGKVVVYLNGLDAKTPLMLTYTLRATMPAKAVSGLPRVYEYYDPSKEATAAAHKFVVRE